MRLWLISLFEQTPVDHVFSTRFLSIADEAYRRGHEVTFIGSTFKHNTKNQRFDRTTAISLKPGYDLLFVESQGYSSNISMRRLWAHYTFGKKLLLNLASLPRPDAIVLAFPPISVAHQVSQWAASHHIPLIMDVIDPWPDTIALAFPTALRPLHHILLSPLRLRLCQTLQRLQAITSISQQYLQWANAYFSQIPIQKVFYPASNFAEIRESISSYQRAEGRSFQVIYAGSLGKSYDIPCILATAAMLEAKYPRIAFKIAGAGPQEQLVRTYQSTHRNLTFLGRVSKAELMRHYAESDLGLTQHIRGATQTVTYKLFDLLAAGLPILNSLESEMKDLILRHKVGLHNKPGDTDALAENILWFYHHPSELRNFRKNGFQLTEREGDAAVVYHRYVNLLEAVIRSETLVEVK